jgi:lipopolysaccharide transport system permease protein
MAQTLAGNAVQNHEYPQTPVYSSATSNGLSGRLRTLFERRNLIWELTARNLKIRYRRSVFGFLWALLNPLLNALVFGVVFGVLLKSPIDRFVLFIIVGILAWNAFASSVLEAMAVITGSANLVARVRFPHEVLPISTVLANMINLVLALPSVFLVMVLTHTPLYPQLILLPWVLVCLFCFALGISFMSAATNVFFRDTRNFLDVVMSLWFFLTPIIYNLDIAFRTREGQRLVYWLNPMASIVTLMRHMFYTSYWDAPSFLLRTTFACVITMVAGWIYFARMSDRFVEEL